MDKPLDDLISAFTETAASLFPRVARHLGASQPISNIEWACLEVPQKGETSDGVKYFKHGYGVSMYDGHRTINMDVGNNGEIDGIDPGRLFDFAKENGIATPFRNYSDIEPAIKQATEAGELKYSGDILYFRVI